MKGEQSGEEEEKGQREERRGERGKGEGGLFWLCNGINPSSLSLLHPPDIQLSLHDRTLGSIWNGGRMEGGEREGGRGEVTYRGAVSSHTLPKIGSSTTSSSDEGNRIL